MLRKGGIVKGVLTRRQVSMLLFLQVSSAFRPARCGTEMPDTRLRIGGTRFRTGSNGNQSTTMFLFGFSFLWLFESSSPANNGRCRSIKGGRLSRLNDLKGTKIMLKLLQHDVLRNRTEGSDEIGIKTSARDL